MPNYEILSIEDKFPHQSKCSYVEKHGKDENAFIQSNWASFAEQNPSAFNGKKAILYAREDKDPEKLRIVKSNYANIRAALAHEKPDSVNLRPHFAAGVAIVCETSDGKIVVGSRDATRQKDNLDKYMAQFPCGFIDVDEQIFNGMRTKEGLRDVIIKNGLRELKEELYNFSDEQILDKQFIGGIFERKTWPSKKSGTKEIKNFKSLVITVTVGMTFDELQEARRTMPPQDINEMTIINAIPKNEIEEGMTIELEGKNREFVAEHPAVFLLLLAQNKEQGIAI